MGSSEKVWRASWRKRNSSIRERKSGLPSSDHFSPRDSVPQIFKFIIMTHSIQEVLLFFFFKFYTQCGAPTHDPEIKT